MAKFKVLQQRTKGERRTTRLRAGRDAGLIAATCWNRKRMATMQVMEQSNAGDQVSVA